MLSSIVFLKDPRWAWLGSAYLRADQLAVILEPVARGFGLALSVSDRLGAHADALVILTKAYLLGASPASLAALKGQGNVVACDFVDLQVSRNLSLASDVLIASSFSLDRLFREHLPEAASFLIPHHADLRIPEGCAQQQDFRAGYFGDPANGYGLAELAAEHLCDVVPAPSFHDPAWIAELPRYSCHYAVRSNRAHDGCKPFTKAVIAAHCGAVVIATRDYESVCCLGEDYPFLVDPRDPSDARRKLLLAREAFGSDLWHAAADRMRRVKQLHGHEAIRTSFTSLVQASMAKAAERRSGQARAGGSGA